MNTRKNFRLCLINAMNAQLKIISVFNTEMIFSVLNLSNFYFAQLGFNQDNTKEIINASTRGPTMNTQSGASASDSASWSDTSCKVNGGAF